MRYLIIAMLLIPAWGWAGTELWISKDKDLSTVESISYQENGKRIEINVACYQRMREVMQNRSTQEYLKKRWMFRWAEESNKEERYAIWEQMREDERLKELNARWDQTMKDCVEGK